MNGRTRARRLASGLSGLRAWFAGIGVGALVLALAVTAAAQGVTGTVSGTVKDAQGGVVPGATVVLLSETKGTRSAPAVTNVSGDFVFPNVAGDTYTAQVEMPSFRTLRRPGVAVSAGSQVSVGTLTIELGGMAEVLTVTTAAPLLQSASGERSSVVVASDVKNLSAGFQGPAVGSVGLDSPANYLRACADLTMDTAIARTIRLGGNRTLQLRVDMFNTFNRAAVTGRNSTLQLASPTDSVSITNLPVDATGAVIPTRSLPRGAGFGVATGYQTPRTMQIQARFAF